MDIVDKLQNSRRNRTNLYSKTDAVQSFVDHLFESYQNYRVASGVRAVNKNDYEKYKRHIELVILDLLSAWESDPTKCIGYSRGNGVRRHMNWNKFQFELAKSLAHLVCHFRRRTYDVASASFQLSFA